MTVVIFLAAYLTLVGSFWPYMIPFSVTIGEAAAPPHRSSSCSTAPASWSFRSC